MYQLRKDTRVVDRRLDRQFLGDKKVVDLQELLGELDIVIAL